MSVESAADALLHPVRLRIVQALVGRELTTLQLQRVVGDVPIATLYRHVNRLVDAGFLKVVAERQVRGSVERTLAVEEASLPLPDLPNGRPEEMIRHFATFLGTLLHGFGRYARSGETRSAREAGVGYGVTPLWLTDAELAALADGLHAQVDAARSKPPGGNRKRRVLSIVLFPGVDEAEAAGSA